MKEEVKGLSIREKKEYTDGDIFLSHLEDTGKCHIMTSYYGEVTSVALNKTQVKRVIKWLQRWIEFKEKKKNERRS